MLWKSLMAIVALMGILHPASSQASVIDKRMSVSDLTTQADGIFVGTVLSSKGYRATERSEIFTTITLDVQTALKGHPGKDGTIQLEVPGGQVGEDVEVIAGNASFSPGEHVLVFVSSDMTTPYRLVGMAQGKFTLRQDALNQEMALNEPAGLYLLVPDRETESLLSIQAPAEQYPLVELVRQIKDLTNPALVMR